MTIRTSVDVSWWDGYQTTLIDRPLLNFDEVDAIKQYLQREVKGMYYNPIPFMEFRDIPPLRHWPEERWHLMGRIDFTGKHVVDIGANMGYYSFLAAEAGAGYVVPVETYKKGCHVMERVAKNYGVDVLHTVSQNIVDFPFNTMKPDVVMAFSVLPYLGQPDPEPLKNVLSDMAKYASVSFIEMGDGGSGLDWCKGDAAFYDLFAQCGFRSIRNLGPTQSSHSNTERTFWECRGTL